MYEKEERTRACFASYGRALLGLIREGLIMFQNSNTECVLLISKICLGFT